MGILILTLTGGVNAQVRELDYKTRTFQLSFFPGISTNGIESGQYFNKFSVNIFSGFSAGNAYFEIAGISNTNTQLGSGIQLGGLANMVGSNTFLNLTLREERGIVQEGFSSDFRGIQFSGLINYVRDNAEGFRVSGGFNINGRYGSGLQLSGLMNMSGGHFVGLQIAGLSNVAYQGMTGIQLALVFNHTEGELRGFQVGVANKARRMGGKNSQPPTGSKGFQLGVVNISERMDGYQVGLINIGSRNRGTQIGLINIFKPGPHAAQSSGKNSTPIGLINIGTNGGHARLYTNETFSTIFEYTTGSCQNCAFNASQMPPNERFKVMNQNALIIAFNPFGGDELSRGFGYGFEKVMYTKSSLSDKDPGNHKKFISLGTRIMYLDRDGQSNRALSLLNTVHAEFGYRIKFIHVFAGFSMNTYLHKGEALKQGLEISNGTIGKLKYQFWPGYTVGLHLF